MSRYTLTISASVEIDDPEYDHVRESIEREADSWLRYMGQEKGFEVGNYAETHLSPQ